MTKGLQPSSLRQDSYQVLAVAGKSLPFAMLFNDMASRPKETDCSKETRDSLRQLADLLFKDEVDSNPEAVAEIMRTTEPFASEPAFIDEYIDRQS